MEEPEEVFLYNGQDKREIPRNITHVRCDSSVTEIPVDLFNRCESLVTVELNEGIKRIGERAFMFCTSLRNATFPSTLEEIGSHAFRYCEELVTAGLNEGLKKIGGSAFHGCTTLTSVNFPSTLENIERKAFFKCKRLVNAELNEGLKRIGKEAFYECFSLRSINFPSALEEIEEYAFRNCKNLVNVELNEGLKVIGERAFYGCQSLRSINFPSTLQEIGKCAFHNCKSLRQVSIPSSVKKIDDFAFAWCDALKSLELPNGLEVIRKGVFKYCKSLKSLFVPSTVKKIEKDAFGLCFKLESVELPEHLEEIGEGAFYACDKLRNVSIPSTVTKLGRIFKNWQGDSKPPSLLSEQFPNDDDDCSLLVNALKTRFDGLPIHELCYYQAHHPPAAVLQKLRHTVSSKGISVDRCDVLGMSPFHILALSTKPNIELFRALMELFPTNFLHKKDAGGSRAIDYSIDNESSGSDDFTKVLLQAMFGDRIKHLGLEEWRTAVMNETENIQEVWEQGVERRQRQLDIIYSALEKYERLEVLSLLEMCLWSTKMDESNAREVNPSLSEQRKKKAKICDDSDRQGYRINCGSDIILPNVLLYLDDKSTTSEGDDDSSSSSSAGSESEGDY